jgi:hypothetical protein
MPTLISITILVIIALLSTLRLPTTLVLSMTTRDACAMLLVMEKVIVLRMKITIHLIQRQKLRRKLRLKLRLKLRPKPRLRLRLILTQLTFLTHKKNSRTSGRSPIIMKTNLLGPCTRSIVPWIISRRSWLKYTPSSRLKA